MPADGTVEDSIVKQSANGGNVDVDNGMRPALRLGQCPPLLSALRILAP